MTIEQAITDYVNEASGAPEYTLSYLESCLDMDATLELDKPNVDITKGGRLVARLHVPTSELHINGPVEVDE